jgi:hypothetical protein
MKRVLLTLEMLEVDFELGDGVRPILMLLEGWIGQRQYTPNNAHEFLLALVAAKHTRIHKSCSRNHRSLE